MSDAEKIGALASAIPVGSRWQHVNRGTRYTVVGHCMIEATWRPGVRYVGDADCRIEIVRDGGEFMDGRFKPMSAHQ